MKTDFQARVLVEVNNRFTLLETWEDELETREDE
jgi:hypothetical protein